MKKLWDLKKVFINLELEGRWHGIIMGVTRLILLEPFYTIQTQTHQTYLGGVYVNKKHSFIWVSEFFIHTFLSTAGVGIHSDESTENFNTLKK